MCLGFGANGQTALTQIQNSEDSLMVVMTFPHVSGNNLQQYISLQTLADSMRIDTLNGIYSGSDTLIENTDVAMEGFDIDFINSNGDKITLDGSILSVNNSGGANYEVQTTGTQALIGTVTNHPVLIQTNLNEVARFLTTGQLNLNNYNGSTFTGTEAALLGIESGGNVISASLSDYNKWIETTDASLSENREIDISTYDFDIVSDPLTGAGLQVNGSSDQIVLKVSDIEFDGVAEFKDDVRDGNAAIGSDGQILYNDRLIVTGKQYQNHK